MQKSRIITTAVSFAVAMAIGAVMQYGPQNSQQGAVPLTIKASMTPASQAPEAEAPKPKSMRQADLELENITRTAAAMPREADLPALPESPVRTVAANADDALVVPEELSTPTFSCAVQMAAVSGPAAMVALDISAPCMPNERLTIHHNGMMFDSSLDANGTAYLTVPAFAAQSVFIAALANGEGAVSVIPVMDIDDYARVAIQWKGNTGLELHALEYGARYGSDGHVWADAQRDQAVALAGQGGFFTRLGQETLGDGLFADVYTFPAAQARRAGDIALSVEAAVNSDNCGREIAAQTLEKRDTGKPRVQDLSLSIPACEAVGDFLVLKNILQDLKVASN